MLFPKHLSAQSTTTWFEHWVATEPGQSTQVQNGLLERIATYNDPVYGLYVASSTYNATTEVHDLQIGLYDDMGNTLWSSQFNITNGGDVLVGNIVADGAGNVYFTGAVDNGSNSFDALTVKFNSLGNTVWQKTYNGTANGYDGGIDLVLHASGNVYITGIATETVISRDFLTLAYNSTGTLLWSQLYDGSGLVDLAAKIGLVGSNIMVVGAEQNSATTWNMAAVVYNHTNGTELGNTNLSPNIALDGINGFATDASDNVYIAGARQGSGTGLDALTIKLDSDLNILWEKTYDHSGGDDVANALAVATNGNVSVAGYATTANGTDFLVLNYKSDGTLNWSDLRNGAKNVGDGATDVAVDADGDVFVTGYMNEVGNLDYYTVIYTANGTEVWSELFNNKYNNNDEATSIQLDDDGFLVTGWSEATGGGNETTIIKYGESCQFIIPPDPQPQSSAIGFLKNNDQLKKTNGSAAPEVLYYRDLGGHYFQNNSISFTLAKIGPPDQAFRVDMKFDPDRPEKRVIAMERRSDYYNFYLENVPDGRELVPMYKRMVYCDAFDGVDIEVSTNSGGMKYYYIVKPGHRPSNIQLEFEGQNGLGGVNGELHIQTSLGNIILPEAVAYEVDNTGQRIPLSWIPYYSVSGNIVSFSVGAYNPSNYLVIEAKHEHCGDFTNENDNLKWNTYHGGSYEGSLNAIDDIFRDITTDNIDHDVVVTGDTYSQDFPSNTNLNQGTFANSSTIVVKFDENGIKQWALMFGGSQSDQGNALEVDSEGKINVVGYTTSSDFPTKEGAIVNWYDDILDQFLVPYVAQFTDDGKMIFCSYFEGNDFGRAESISISTDGKFYVGGSGKTPPRNLDMSQFANTNGAAFISRFSSDFLTHEWTSQYGENFTVIAGIATDSNGDVFLSGDTNGGVPQIGAGALPYSGVNDACIAKLSSPPHNLEWSSNFGGSQDDRARDIVIDDNDDVYVVGRTSSSGSGFNDFGISGNLNGITDGFIIKFDNNMNPIQAEYVGSDDQDDITAVAFDGMDNLYFIGFTKSTITTAAPSGFYEQQAIGGGVAESDVWIYRTNKTLSSDWNTYMGGQGDDRAECVAINSNNKMYIAGYTDFIIPEDVDFPLRPHLVDESYFDCDVGTDQESPDFDSFISMFDIDFISSARENTFNSNLIQVFPNPVSEYLTIKGNSLEPYYGQLSDAMGRKLKLFELNGNVEYQYLNLDFLHKGIYSINFYGDGWSETLKIIIQ